MTRLVACLLLLSLFGCAQGAHIQKVRTAADMGEDVLVTLDSAIAIPAGYAAEKCQTSDDYTDCMKGWIRTVNALQAAHHAHKAMIASLDGAELASDNPGGMVMCFAEAVSQAIRAAQDVGVTIDSRAATSWAKFAGTLGTMCEYSTDATLGHGSAEGE